MDFDRGGVVVIAVVDRYRSSASRRKRTARLQERFGPEYERTVLEAGEQKTAEKELAARERKRDKLNIVALTPEALAKYANRWQMVQTAFVDNPSSAVGDADRLVTEVMRERGYPVDDFDQQAADISVDHPTVVENYRAAHSIHLSQQKRRRRHRGAASGVRPLPRAVREVTRDTEGQDTSQEATA